MPECMIISLVWIPDGQNDLQDSGVWNLENDLRRFETVVHVGLGADEENKAMTRRRLL